METNRAMASIRTIRSLEPIPDADLIELAKVDGWQSIVKKGEFAVGDQVVYLTIDSWVPTTIAPFLTKQGKDPAVYEGIQGERLKTIKLKRTLSQGLILPLTILGESAFNPFNDHDDVSELLGVIKWEPPVTGINLAGNPRCSFPAQGRRTDQERLENICDLVFANPDWLYEVTLKLDGSSISVLNIDGDIHVCSRNIDLKLDDSNAENQFVKTANSTGLIDAMLKLGRNLQVSGELMGPGIQGNREKLTDYTIYVFDMFDIDNQIYLTPSERARVYDRLVELGFTGEHVPVIRARTTLAEIGIIDVATSKIFVNMPSIISPIAEGCVFKRVDGMFSFKSINNAYLLKFDC